MEGAVRQFLGPELLEKNHIPLQGDLVASRRITSPDGQDMIAGGQVSKSNEQAGRQKKKAGAHDLFRYLGWY